MSITGPSQPKSGYPEEDSGMGIITSVLVFAHGCATSDGNARANHCNYGGPHTLPRTSRVPSTQ